MPDVVAIRQFLIKMHQSVVAGGSNDPVFIGESGVSCLREQLMERVNHLSAFFKASGVNSWALSCSNCEHFIVSLLALIKAGKIILLPANDKPGTLQESSRFCDALLTDNEESSFSGSSYLFSALRDQQDGLLLGDRRYWDESHRARLIFYTSGSSGHPQAVWKTLAQLEQEVIALEKLWGAQLAASTILSCVSHQHIYGFLFRLLWPLLTGRVIDVRRLDYPEEILSVVSDYQQVALVASPAQLKRLPQELDWLSVSEHLTAVFSSGALLTATEARLVRQSFGVYPLEVLGSTETGGVAWRQQDPNKDNSDCWCALPFVSINQKNNLLQVFSPWLELPTCGFVMADIAQVVGLNRFLLLGRVDSLVKVEGKRVSLEEVCRRLVSSSFVSKAEAVVLESGRTQLGVVVVLSEDGSDYLSVFGRLALSRRLKTLLSDYFDTVTLPKKWRYVDQIPVNRQGKIIRKELACLFE